MGNAKAGLNIVLGLIVLFNFVLGPIYWWLSSTLNNQRTEIAFAPGWMGLVVIFYTIFLMYGLLKSKTTFVVGGVTATAVFFLMFYLRDAVFYSKFAQGVDDSEKASHAVAGLAAFQFVLHLPFIAGLFFLKRELIQDVSFNVNQ